MIIYKLTSPSEKIYIGQTSSNIELRFNQHINAWKKWSKNKSKKGFCTKLFYAFESHDPETWTKEIIYETPFKENLDKKEMYFIQLYDTINNGYNITKGGSGRKVEFLDEAHKQNISIAKKEFFETEEGKEWKKNASERNLGKNNPMYGKTYNKTDEAKKLMSEKMKGKNKGKTPWNKGTKGIYSEEQLQKMSDNRKGKGLGKDNSKNMKGKSQTDYQKQRASESKGKNWVIIDPEGNEFEIFSLNKFCKENALDQGNLSRGKHKGYKAYKT